MWMEENIGTRINADRTAEAVQTLSWTSTSAQQGAIATGCPFCRVMLTDGLTAQQADGTAPPSMEVLDVAQLLLESVNRNSAAT
jgi:Fe-S oxidoreductase